MDAIGEEVLRVTVTLFIVGAIGAIRLLFKVVSEWKMFVMIEEKATTTSGFHAWVGKMKDRRETRRQIKSGEEQASHKSGEEQASQKYYRPIHVAQEGKNTLWHYSQTSDHPLGLFRWIGGAFWRSMIYKRG